MATHSCDLFKPSRQNLLVARSTFAGSGKFSGRWLGENKSTFEYMAQSIAGIMMSNIFGIPFSGADICGYLSNTTAELCTRWHFVGAFYPLSRNQNDVNSISQEPYVFKNQIYDKTQTSYMGHMRDAILLKYSLLPYYFAQLNKIKKEGGTFFKPVWFEFPWDQKAYENVTDNFMLGDALKVSI